MRRLLAPRLHVAKLASVRVLRHLQEKAPEIPVRRWTAFRARAPEGHLEVQVVHVSPWGHRGDQEEEGYDDPLTYPVWLHARLWGSLLEATLTPQTVWHAHCLVSQTFQVRQLCSRSRTRLMAEAKMIVAGRGKGSGRGEEEHVEGRRRWRNRSRKSARE